MKKSDNKKPEDSFASEDNIKNESKLSRREALKRIANTSLGVAILTLPAIPVFSFIAKQESELSMSSKPDIEVKENSYLDKANPKDVVYSPDGYSVDHSDYGVDHYDHSDYAVDHYDYSNYSNYYNYYNYYSYYCYYGSS